MTQSQTFLEENGLAIAANINFAVRVAHGLAVDAGWHTDLETGLPYKKNKFESLALIHSEVSEMVEGVRKPGKLDDHLTDELMEHAEAADVFIRLADYCGLHEISLGELVIKKLSYNKNRADHKIENRLAEGGKKF